MRRVNTRKYLFLFFVLFSASIGLEATSIDVGFSGDTRLAERIVSTARDMLGTPYHWAGVSRTGVDCSGLVYYVFQKAAGRQLPRGVRELRREGKNVEGELMPGDLLFFDTVNGGYASHVGISLGGKRFIHAASEGRETGVIISDLDQRYYKTRYLGSRRVIEENKLVIEIHLDSRSEEISFGAVLDPEQEVTVKIISSLEDLDYLKLRMEREGKSAITKRFLDNLDRPLEADLVPGTDNWTITLSDDIKRELVVVSFSGKSGD